jgi:hypothetical protein
VADLHHRHLGGVRDGGVGAELAGVELVADGVVAVAQGRVVGNTMWSSRTPESGSSTPICSCMAKEVTPALWPTTRAPPATCRATAASCTR